MRQTYTCEVLPSDYRFDRDPAGGLTIYKAVISVRRTSRVPKKAVEGLLIRRWGPHEEILTTTRSGGSANDASRGGDDMVLDQEMFGLVKHVARQLRMSMKVFYDARAGPGTAEENEEY